MRDKNGPEHQRKHNAEMLSRPVRVVPETYPRESAPRPTPQRASADREQRAERLTGRMARHGGKVKMTLLRPVRRYTDEPTLTDELEYLREVAGELLIELERTSSVSKDDAERLLRAAENMWALVTKVEVREEEVEIA